MIYLDNNATTPVDPEVYDAVFSSLKRDIGNPSSSHAAGLRARETIARGRAQVAELIGCGPEEIVFTSGGTESNNLSILGTALRQEKGHIITSAIEHPSVLNACRHLESLGYSVTYAPADADGFVSVDAIRKAVRRDTLLITVMHANNETGVIQPVAEIGGIAQEQAIAFHTDAAQSVGKMPFSVSDAPVSLMTLVSHKFYGPKGIGALYVRKETPLTPILFGAGHEQGLRPGTENVAGIVGMGKACQIALRDMKLRISHTRGLRDLLFSVLKEKIPGVSLNGHAAHRLPNTLSIRFPGIRALDLIERLKDSVAASAGSACHAGRDVPSAVLKAMGLTDDDALSSVRLSVGKDNTEEEVREAAGIISLAAAALGSGQ